MSPTQLRIGLSLNWRAHIQQPRARDNGVKSLQKLATKRPAGIWHGRSSSLTNWIQRQRGNLHPKILPPLMSRTDLTSKGKAESLTKWSTTTWALDIFFGPERQKYPAVPDRSCQRPNAFFSVGKLFMHQSLYRRGPWKCSPRVLSVFFPFPTIQT